MQFVKCFNETLLRGFKIIAKGSVKQTGGQKRYKGEHAGPSHYLFSRDYRVRLPNALPTSVFSSGFPLSASLFWLPSIQKFPLKTLKEHMLLCSEPSKRFPSCSANRAQVPRRPVRPCGLCPYHPSALISSLPLTVPPDPATPASLMIFEYVIYLTAQNLKSCCLSAWNSLSLNEN